MLEPLQKRLQERGRRSRRERRTAMVRERGERESKRLTVVAFSGSLLVQLLPIGGQS